MTIYDLLKNSSPSMAKHFMDSDGNLSDIDLLVTKKLYNSVREPTNMYKVLL